MNENFSSSLSSSEGELSNIKICTKKFKNNPKRGYKIKVGGMHPNIKLDISQKKSIFDKSFTSLIINIPKKYQPDIIGFLRENSKKIIKLVKKEIVDDQINTFGLYFNITLKMSKIHINEGESIQPMHIVSPRYILRIGELQSVFKIILQLLTDRIETVLLDTSGSGLTVDSISLLEINYHKVIKRQSLGYYEIPWPSKCRGKDSIFNPHSKVKKDQFCLLRCLAAFKHAKKNKKMGLKIDWMSIKRKLENPSNISKYLKIKSVWQNQWDDIANLERQNKIKIVVYKLYAKGNNENYFLDLMRKGTNKFKKKVNLIFYKDKNINPDIYHVYLIKKTL